MMTGGDDGIFRIWDLRTLRPSGEAPPPAAHFKVRDLPSALVSRRLDITSSIISRWHVRLPSNSTTTHRSHRSNGVHTTVPVSQWQGQTTRYAHCVRCVKYGDWISSICCFNAGVKCMPFVNLCLGRSQFGTCRSSVMQRMR